MKKVVFLFFASAVLFACQNDKNTISNTIDEEVEALTLDSLPEGKWNGEYMKVEAEEDDVKKPKRKGFGSDIYSMGKVNIYMEQDTVLFQIFERRKNVMTFTTQKVRAFIRSAFNEDIHLTFTKDKIVTSPNAKYNADPSGEKNNGVKMTIKALVNDEIEEYTFTNGYIQITTFDPNLGNLVAEIKGEFENSKGEKQKTNGIIDMRFEEAIMVPE